MVDQSPLAFEDVAVTYDSARGSRAVLQGIDLTIDAGELLVLMGASGSGKSTLLRLAGGLQAPTSGTVSLFGVVLSDLSRHERTALRLASVGYVFQELNLLAHLDAVENVALPLELSGMPRRESRERALEALEQVGLSALTRSYPGELSGGEQQRAAIARALAMPRAVLLCDEPSGALDSVSTTALMGLLRDAADTGVGCLVATHDPLVADAGDRVVSLRDGQIESVGAPR